MSLHLIDMHIICLSHIFLIIFSDNYYLLISKLFIKLASIINN